MPRRLAFSHYLMGSSSAKRPSFFYAYLALWLHFLAGGGLLALLTPAALPHALVELAMCSLSLGAVLYGLLVRDYTLLLNALPYGLGLFLLWRPETLDPLFSLAALIVALASAYFVLSREYRRYNNAQAAPLWTTGGALLVLALLVLYGLELAKTGVSGSSG